VTEGGQGGAPWRSLGLGCAFRFRWRDKAVGRGGVGATRLGLRCEEGRHACPFGRRVGDSADRRRRPHTTADRRRAKVRPSALAVSGVCHSAVCRPDAGTAHSSADGRPSPDRADSRGGKHWIQTRCLIHNRQPGRLQPPDPLTPQLLPPDNQTHTIGNREVRRHRSPDDRPWQEWIRWRLSADQLTGVSAARLLAAGWTCMTAVLVSAPSASSNQLARSSVMSWYSFCSSRDT
jgi:hypothetical protein